MSLFTDFEEEEIILLVSLPYRVGMWISHVDDDADTEHDDQREAVALQAVLKDIAKDKNKPFTATVVQETLKYPEMWEQWGGEQKDVLDDVQKANALIKGRMPAENIKNFRKSILDVAKTVALAFSESGGDGYDVERESMLGGLVVKIRDLLNKTPDNPDNISVKERAALQKLMQTLKS